MFQSGITKKDKGTDCLIKLLGLVPRQRVSESLWEQTVALATRGLLPSSGQYSPDMGTWSQRDDCLASRPACRWTRAAVSRRAAALGVWTRGDTGWRASGQRVGGGNGQRMGAGAEKAGRTAAACGSNAGRGLWGTEKGRFKEWEVVAGVMVPEEFFVQTVEICSPDVYFNAIERCRLESDW